MLGHLPTDSLVASSATLAWIGALVLVVGESVALMNLPNLGRVFVISTIAEFGYVLIGFGVGGPAGDTGALMHLGFQAVMRGLVFAAGWTLVRQAGSTNLSEVAGSGQRTPLTATLFGFGVFSVMGLSPFKGSFSKFIVLYAAIEHGLWPVALAGTVATIVAAIYYMLIVQRICLEPKAREDALAPTSPVALRLAYVLGALTLVLSLWPAPFLEFAARLAGFPGARGVPQFELALGPPGPGPLCRRLPRLRDRSRLRASARRSVDAAGDRDCRGRGV